MTRKDSNRSIAEIKALIAEDSDFLRPMVRTMIQEFLEAEMAEAVGVQKGERVEGRVKLSKRLLCAPLNHPDRKARIASAAGS